MGITPIQKLIESSVTGGRLYHDDAEFALFHPYSISPAERDTQIGLQRALFNMEVRDGKYDFDSASHTRLLFSRMIAGLKASHIPISSIVTLNEFNSALDQDRVHALESYESFPKSLRRKGHLQLVA